jgi:hypothetical protein
MQEARSSHRVVASFDLLVMAATCTAVDRTPTAVTAGLKGTLFSTLRSADNRRRPRFGARAF